MMLLAFTNLSLPPIGGSTSCTPKSTLRWYLAIPCMLELAYVFCIVRVEWRFRLVQIFQLLMPLIKCMQVLGLGWSGVMVGLKRKFKHLMNRFHSTRSKSSQFFWTGCLLTKFLHRCRLDYTMKIYGEENDGDDIGWYGDF